MKKIPLTQGKVAIVDNCDYDYLMQWKWCYKKAPQGNGGYAAHHPRINGKRRWVRMHRVVLNRMGFEDFNESDHINHDKLDNRRKNLRPSTRGQNRSNRPKQKNNTSGYKGVSFRKDLGKWCARIQVNKKSISLGMFDNRKDAARAYNGAAPKYHGEFAMVNKMESCKEARK